MRHTRLKTGIKVLSFILIFILLFGFVQNALVKRDPTDAQIIPQFYDERENSLDAVYIGSSNGFTYWNSAVAFEEYGICVYPYSCNSQSFYAAKHIIKEVRKTQPQATFVVNINSVNEGSISVDSMHYLLDVMPFSFNKLSLIHHLSNINGYTLKERMEFYFPIIRFHSRTGELTPDDFGVEPDGLKGACTYYKYLEVTQNVSAKVVSTDQRGELSQKLVDYTNDLLDYCDKEKVNVIFVTVPQAKGNKGKIRMYNALNDLIRERGYEALDLNEKFDQLGIDPAVDFYNDAHTNIHGSIKYTHFMAKYLVDKYGFTDKREDENYADWQESLNKYKDEIKAKVLDFEWDSHARLYDLQKPKATVVANGDNVTVSWDPVTGANGYAVYRKEGFSGGWERLTTSTKYVFADTDVKPEATYYYAVVPYAEKDGKCYYGNYKYNGIKVKN